MELTIEESGADGQRVLALAGALDIASRARLLEAGAAALAAGDLVLDLAEIDFIDSSGLGAVITLAGDAEDAGRGFVLQAPSDRVLRVLRISGLLDAWTIVYPDD